MQENFLYALNMFLLSVLRWSTTSSLCSLPQTANLSWIVTSRPISSNVTASCSKTSLIEWSLRHTITSTVWTDNVIPHPPLTVAFVSALVSNSPADNLLGGFYHDSASSYNIPNNIARVYDLDRIPSPFSSMASVPTSSLLTPTSFGVYLLLATSIVVATPPSLSLHCSAQASSIVSATLTVLVPKLVVLTTTWWTCLSFQPITPSPLLPRSCVTSYMYTSAPNFRHQHVTAMTMRWSTTPWMIYVFPSTAILYVTSTTVKFQPILWRKMLLWTISFAVNAFPTNRHEH